MRKFQPQAGFVVQAFRFALDPNAGQEAALRSHCGAARAAYNWAVGWVQAAWWQRNAEESYGISTDDLTPWRPWSFFALRREFNRIKHADPRFAEWWDQNSKEAYSTGLAGAAAAFDNYTKSKNGARKGPRMGLPRFKSKHRSALSCRFTTSPIRVEPDRRHVTLPRIGAIRTHENTGKLQRRIARGTARILSATITHSRGRWMVSFQVEIKRAAAGPVRSDVVAGVDLGVKHLAVVADSTGTMRYVPNPRHLDGELARLRSASRLVSRRQGPDRSAGQQPSNRWKRANEARNRVHHRVANLRTDALHKLTSSICAQYGTVVVEDLNVAGMLRNHKLARRIADAGFGEIRRQIEYKTTWNDGTMVVADRWFPSSKTCSGCGAVKTKLSLHIRTFECDACGLNLDRDANAARNLAALAASVNTGTGVAGDQGAQAPKPRGASQKTRKGQASRKADPARAGGETLPQQLQKETRDRHRNTEALTL